MCSTACKLSTKYAYVNFFNCFYCQGYRRQPRTTANDVIPSATQCNVFVALVLCFVRSFQQKSNSQSTCVCTCCALCSPTFYCEKHARSGGWISLFRFRTKQKTNLICIFLTHNKKCNEFDKNAYFTMKTMTKKTTVMSCCVNGFTLKTCTTYEM